MSKHLLLLSSGSNSVGAKSEMVEKLSAGEDGVETWASISISGEKPMPRNVANGSVLFEPEEGPSTTMGVAVGSATPGTEALAVVAFLWFPFFLSFNHLSWIS